jgi:hypothetical protein
MTNDSLSNLYFSILAQVPSPFSWKVRPASFEAMIERRSASPKRPAATVRRGVVFAGRMGSIDN